MDCSIINNQYSRYEDLVSLNSRLNKNDCKDLKSNCCGMTLQGKQEITNPDRWINNCDKYQKEIININSGTKTDVITTDLMKYKKIIDDFIIDEKNIIREIMEKHTNLIAVLITMIVDDCYEKNSSGTYLEKNEPESYGWLIYNKPYGFWLNINLAYVNDSTHYILYIQEHRDKPKCLYKRITDTGYRALSYEVGVFSENKKHEENYKYHNKYKSIIVEKYNYGEFKKTYYLDSKCDCKYSYR